MTLESILQTERLRDLQAHLQEFCMDVQGGKLGEPTLELMQFIGKVHALLDDKVFKL